MKTNSGNIIGGIVFFLIALYGIMSQPVGTERAGLAIFIALTFIVGYYYGANSKEEKE